MLEIASLMGHVLCPDERLESLMTSVLQNQMHDNCTLGEYGVVRSKGIS